MVRCHLYPTSFERGGVTQRSHVLASPLAPTRAAYVEVEDEARWAAIAQSDVCKRWWAWMTEFIVFKADGTPDAIELKEVFFFDPSSPGGR